MLLFTNGKLVEGKETGKEFNEKVNFNFTHDKWGGFDMGDGEYFVDEKILFNRQPDFYIFSEKKGDFYETTFIPNPFNVMDTSKWDDKDQIEAFKYATTYRTNEADVIKKIKSKKSYGIYKISFGKDFVEVDDMMWYYIGMCDTGELVIKCNSEKHPKFKDLSALRVKYKK